MSVFWAMSTSFIGTMTSKATLFVDLLLLEVTSEWETGRMNIMGDYEVNRDCG